MWIWRLAEQLTWFRGYPLWWSFGGDTTARSVHNKNNKLQQPKLIGQLRRWFYQRFFSSINFSRISLVVRFVLSCYLLSPSRSRNNFSMFVKEFVSLTAGCSRTASNTALASLSSCYSLQLYFSDSFPFSSRFLTIIACTPHQKFCTSRYWTPDFPFCLSGFAFRTSKI